MSEMLSPGVYLRCSENSTEKPWKGLACSPEMNPSTMNLARRSSRATWRITSGFRYFSAVPAKELLRGPGREFRRLGRRASSIVLGHVGLSDLGDELLDQAVGRLPLGLRLEVGADAVPQDGDRHLADVVQGD